MMNTDQQWSEEDRGYMHEALVLAGQGAAAGEVPVGALVVQDGEIIGAAHNRTLTDVDPSAHAELLALRAAASLSGNHRLNEATLYVTLEPCSMCVGVLAEARIARVVFGAYDDKSGACGSAVNLAENAALNHVMEVNGGLLAEECGEVLRDFFAERRD